MITNINTCVRFSLLFIVLNLIRTTNGVPPDLTFIVKTNDSGYIRPFCIGKGDVLKAAVTWIYPIPNRTEKLPFISSNYVPERNVEFNCDFSISKKCNKIWQKYGWEYSTLDTYSFKPIIDSRWESFPTYLTSNSTKEFSTRFDIPSVFEIGFSVRAAKNAEVFVCEGWSPKIHACYYISIGGVDNRQTSLRKYKNGILDKLSKNDTKLAKFKSDSNILTEEEWKTFSLSLNSNGVIALRNVLNNSTILNYTDKTMLKPINFIVRSKNENALWKIHKNNFVFTNKTGVFKLGPEIQLLETDLCVVLYSMICSQCTIKFFIKRNKGKEILMEITNDGDPTWTEVQLQKRDIYDDFVQIYVETDFSDKSQKMNGFWAIDDVRVCVANELKTTYLDIHMTFQEFEKTHLTCQSLKHPNWLPIHQIVSYMSVNNVVCNTSTSTTIKLMWTPTSEDKNFEEYSIIHYEGMDICEYETDHEEKLTNALRRKSQGYVIEKKHEIEIGELVPYTFYNVTFWNVIDGDKKFFHMSTLPTDLPTKHELPRLTNVSITDSSIVIRWDKPKCNMTYGPLVYQLYLKDEKGTRHSVDVVTTYKFDNLQPFSNYTLEIRTARRIETLKDPKFFIKTIYNFTTKPGAKVKNLELYSADYTSASLRFDIPQETTGIPQFVQIRWCHPLFLSGCFSNIQNLTKCALWDFKYCVDVDNLGKGNEYQFTVAIKNKDTYSYGKEESINGTALERVPGKPSNLTYKLVNCNVASGDCNLDIVWTHPYDQNATITMFDVILNESSYDLVADTAKTIHEVVKIKDKQYKNVYQCTIKYITTNVPFKLFVRAVNDVYKGNFEETIINTENVEEYVDQTPVFVECSNETMKFQLPKVSRRLNSSTLIVIVQDYDKSKRDQIDDIVQLETFGNKYTLCNDFGNTWVAKTINLSTVDSQFVVIGDNSSSFIPQLKKDIINKSLKPNTEYCFTFALISEDNNSETLTVFHSKHLITQRNNVAEKQESSSDGHVSATVIVLPVLLIIALICCGVWFLRKYFVRKRILNGEHIYESMPFDDYLPDAVSNANYDRLIHN